jgi:hypothetical protein
MDLCPMKRSDFDEFVKRSCRVSMDDADRRYLCSMSDYVADCKLP